MPFADKILYVLSAYNDFESLVNICGQRFNHNFKSLPTDLSLKLHTLTGMAYYMFPHIHR